MNTKEIRREVAGLLAGGVTAGLTLIAQHYGLKRAHLKRTDAYIAGTLALDGGYVAYALVAGRSINRVAAFFTVQALAGSTVKLMYLIDRKLGTGPQHASWDTGMLQELEAHNGELRAELMSVRHQLEEAKDLDGLIHSDDLLELAAHATTAKENASKVYGSLEALLREQAALQHRLRMSLTRRRAATKAKEKPGVSDRASGSI